MLVKYLELEESDSPLWSTYSPTHVAFVQAVQGLKIFLRKFRNSQIRSYSLCA